MARGPRIVDPGTPYHLTFRGNNRRRLFSRPSDYLKIIRLLERRVERVDCQVHVLILMPNHGHMLGTPGHERAFAELMKPVLQEYAQHRNRARSGSGRLFEERFHSRPMKDDAHFALTHAYIELNAVRAGIGSSPRDHKWSSYHLYASDGRREWSHLTRGICTPSRWYLELANEPCARAERYRTWVAECLARGERPTHAEEMKRYEDASAPYTRRLERPDRSRAR